MIEIGVDVARGGVEGGGERWTFEDTEEGDVDVSKVMAKLVEHWVVAFSANHTRNLDIYRPTP